MNLETNFLDNRTETIKLRKCENNLVIVGMGIMIFGLWNVAKFFSIMFFNKSYLIDEMQNEMRADPATANMQVNGNILFLILFFMFFALFSIMVIFRLFIGFSAISVGKNKRKRFLYIPLSIIYTILCFLDTIVEFYICFFYSSADSFTLEVTESPIISIIIELTSAIMFIELIINSIRIRKLRKIHGIGNESITQITEESLADVDSVTNELGQHLHMT